MDISREVVVICLLKPYICVPVMDSFEGTHQGLDPIAVEEQPSSKRCNRRSGDGRRPTASPFHPARLVIWRASTLK